MPPSDVLKLPGSEYVALERMIIGGGTLAERRMQYLLATLIATVTAIAGKAARVEEIAPWLPGPKKRKLPTGALDAFRQGKVTYAEN